MARARQARSTVGRRSVSTHASAGSTTPPVRCRKPGDRRFTDEQIEHGSSPKLGDFLSEFGQSTLENWQSEFLQLFAFVVLAALYIHKGSAESKDGEEQIQASLRRRAQAVPS
jgi:hypothetical protein